MKCPTSVEECGDVDLCTTMAITGSASTCDALCVATAVDCPDGFVCEDGDCVEPDTVLCGNGVIDDGEACDPKAEGGCPETSDQCDQSDKCLIMGVSGSATDCSASCTSAPVECPEGEICLGGDCVVKDATTSCEILGKCCSGQDND